MKGFIGCLIKIFILIIILGFILFLILQFSGFNCVKKIDKSLPTTEQAPWEVTTPMKLYYAEKTSVVTDDAGIVSVVMTGWYENIKGQWIKRSSPILLERRLYGKIEVNRRGS